MMNKFVRIGISLTLIIIITFSIYRLVLSNESDDYINDIHAQRTEKDVWFGTDFSSPFLKTNTPFHRLNYFEPKQEYAIKAKFIRNLGSDSIKLVTNLGEVQAYLVYGTASFRIRNIDCTLQILYLDAKSDLFIPYMDATSGHSTYGAGRYLETTLPVGNEIVLDFNKAYNPYCAYVESYSCPFPPKSNVLTVAIEAGEKSYH